MAEKMVESANREQEIDMDPSVFYACSNDLMRVDCGLIIQRPPIFLHMRDNAHKFLVDRTKLMEEYFCNTK